VDVQNCKVCGRIFSATKPGVCQKCKAKENDALALVTNSLRDEPGQSVEDLSENTGVEDKLILKFIREGKIASEAITGTVPCGRCGKPAQSLSVRLCPKCLADLQKASAALMNKPVPEPASSSEEGSTVKPAKRASDGDDEDVGDVHQTVKTKRNK